MNNNAVGTYFMAACQPTNRAFLNALSIDNRVKYSTNRKNTALQKAYSAKLKLQHSSRMHKKAQ
jgi:hypothetical protein